MVIEPPEEFEKAVSMSVNTWFERNVAEALERTPPKDWSYSKDSALFVAASGVDGSR